MSMSTVHKPKWCSSPQYTQTNKSLRVHLLKSSRRVIKYIAYTPGRRTGDPA